MNTTAELRCRTAGFQSMRRRSNAALPSTGSMAECMVIGPRQLPMNCLFGPRPLGAFRPLPRSTAESARKQPEGCGPEGLWFMGHAHGSETKGASHEPDGRASLSQASRIGSVPRASSGSPGRTRPTGFVGGQHVWKEQSDASGASVALTSNFRLRNGRYIFGLRSWRSTAAYSLQLMAQLRPTFLVG